MQGQFDAFYSVGVNEWYTSKKCPRCHVFVCQQTIRRLFVTNVELPFTGARWRPITWSLPSKAICSTKSDRCICNPLMSKGAIPGWAWGTLGIIRVSVLKRPASVVAAVAATTTFSRSMRMELGARWICRRGWTKLLNPATAPATALAPATAPSRRTKAAPTGHPRKGAGGGGGGGADPTEDAPTP